MPNTAEKWDNTKEVVKDVPEVEGVTAEPLGGDNASETVVDFDEFKENREKQKRIDAERAELVKADLDKIVADSNTEMSRRQSEKAIGSAPIAGKPWMSDAPSEPIKKPAGNMRTPLWQKNESRGFFAKLFNRKSK